MDIKIPENKNNYHIGDEVYIVKNLSRGIGRYLTNNTATIYSKDNLQIISKKIVSIKFDVYRNNYDNKRIKAAERTVR